MKQDKFTSSICACGQYLRTERAERFEHDVCPECGCSSVPWERVPDQSLRYCPHCSHEWFEDL